MRLWDLETGSQALQLSIEDGVTTVALSPDSRYVAAGSLDKSVRVWDTATGFLVERLEGEPGHKDSVYSVAFSPSGRELVSGSLDKTIKMWELSPARGQGPQGGTCVRTFEGHKVCFNIPIRPFTCACFSGGLKLVLILAYHRTLFSALPLRQAENGYLAAARTAACSSGIQKLERHNSCYRDTRTLVCSPITAPWPIAVSTVY